MSVSFAAASENIVFRENDNWKAVDFSSVEIKSGSALDLSGNIESGAAGQHGQAVISSSGGLAFADNPDTNIRLQGVNEGYWFLNYLEKVSTGESGNDANVARWVRLFRRQGFNLLRIVDLETFLMEGSDTDCVFNPSKVEFADRLFYELGKQGIYRHLTITGYRLGHKDFWNGAWKRTGDFKVQILLGDETIRGYWLAIARDMLNHVNPHTGMAARNDPSVICVEPYNELCSAKGKLAYPDKLKPEVRELFEKKWREWLTKKYGDPGKVAKWREPSLKGKKDFSQARLPRLYESGGMNNAGRMFYIDIAAETMAWFGKSIREIGYNGLIQQFNSNPDLGTSAVRWQGSQIVAGNAYHAHPRGGFEPGATTNRESSISNHARTWCYSKGFSFADRPFFITEYNHCSWNKYRREGGLHFFAYAALNGASSIDWHEGAVRFEIDTRREKPGINAFSLSKSPVSRASIFLSHFLFLRGDVSEAKKRVELVLPNSYLKRNSGEATNSEQRKISMLTKFNISFPEISVKPVGVANPPAADLRVACAAGSKVNSGDWFVTVEDSKKSEFSLDSFVRQIKRRGILSKDNISDPKNGIFQSETGEITMRANEKLVKVITPRTEAVVLGAGRTEELDCLTVKNSSVDAMVAAIAIDGRELAESNRIVLLYSTEETNSGLELTADEKLVKKGSMPVLMRTGMLKAVLKNSRAGRMSVYALGFDGGRVEKVPFKSAAGKLDITISTQKLQRGPTPFFEIVAEE